MGEVLPSAVHPELTLWGQAAQSLSDERERERDLITENRDKGIQFSVNGKCRYHECSYHGIQHLSGVVAFNSYHVSQQPA
jgi:hypothetical protein